MTARMIGVDWGSTAFRAWLFEAGACTAAFRDPEGGLRAVTEHDFAGHLEARLLPWFRSGTTVLLSGMVTSRNGWVETPYLHCPAAPQGLVGQAVWRDHLGMRLGFLPGVCQSTPVADVMRGEEMQILGATRAHPDVLVVLPGTHSKWVRLSGGRIAAFRTFLTGELFHLLLSQSLVGRLASGRAPHPPCFAAGLAASGRTSLLADVFEARAGVLLGSLPAEGVADFLSGLMIGTELRAGLEAFATGGERPLLVGDPALCGRYADALATLGRGCDTAGPEAARDGFAVLAAALPATPTGPAEARTTA